MILAARIFKYLIMEGFKTVKTRILAAMLVRHTAYYNKMLSEGTTGSKYVSCRETVKLLQTEIDFRTHAAGKALL